MKQSKGFTLIELLIVIAIIGILAAVLIPNLLSARNKANIGAQKAEMGSTKSESILYSGGNTTGSFSGVCTTSTEVIRLLVSALKRTNPSATGVTDISTVYSAITDTTANCSGTQEGYAAEIPLLKANSSDTQKYYCIDSTGVALESTTSMLTAAGDVTC